MRALLLAAVLICACSSTRAEEVLRVGDQKGNLRAVMEAADILNDLPYRVDWREFPAAAPLLEALNAGAIDTGGVGDAPFTFAAAAGVPMKAIAATRQKQGGLAILVRKDLPVRSIADLKGRTVATGRGSVGHQLVLAALKAAGLAKDEAKIVFLLPADAKLAYASGSVDAWSTWEPYVAQEEILSGARRIATGEGITPGLSFQVARLDAIRGKRALLEDFVRRAAKARDWSLGHADSYAQSWAALMGVPKDVALLWFTRAEPRFAAIDDGVAADEQKTIDLYAEAGLIAKRIDAEAFLDRSFGSAADGGDARSSN